ncbi:hypothetical protein ACCO45_002944 [Purpureocillium lilacinum]|uniref:Uncharacterized protein n=1 Tax=Purpureocillium lilacinum TaxID=33203 RepID=A0ACC4E181_PURLI
MHLRSVVTLLGAAVAVTASKPRVAAEQLVDAKSPSRPASGRAAEGLSNGTQIIFGRDFDGLNPRPISMLPRRLLQDDTELHPDGCCDKPSIGCGADGCYDPSKNTCCESRGTTCQLGKECIPEGGCCTTGKKGCGSDGCYDPKTDVCCTTRGTTCKTGFECMPDGGCCRTGTKSCGPDKCYDDDKSVCCTSGSDAWTCTKGEKCCAASKSCYDPDKESCCAGGACSLSGSCCGDECCDSDETCGLDKRCTAKTTSTPTSTSTTASSTEASSGETTGAAGTGDGENGIGPGGGRPTSDIERAKSATAAPSPSQTGGAGDRLCSAGRFVAALCPALAVVLMSVL